MKQHLFLVITALLLVPTACEPEVQSDKPLQRPSHVLSGSNAGAGFPNNALTVFDAATWQMHRQVSIPRSRAKNFSRDPQGRIWIGFSGSIQKSDDRLQVYSPQGELLKTLNPCVDPEAGINFAAGRAFVVCAEKGFSGKVVVLNLETLAIEKTIALSLPDKPLLLISSAASEEAVVVVGSGVITLIDPRSLTVQAQLRPGENVDIWRIIPHQGRFYLLNVGSWQQPREQADDVLVLEPGNAPRITPLALAPSPLWGAIAGDALYVYHNPTWNQANSDSSRQMSRLDLTSKEVRTWQLPDGWDASDLAVIDGKVVLARWLGSGGAEDGLYEFDPVSGQVRRQLLNVADASGVIGPR
ncbi:MAG TPA: hypothetical protein VK325_05365 [Pseudoxanthomonas sp.]|nr:hypothetical protein [Pseudoxanthomonas sp.]